MSLPKAADLTIPQATIALARRVSRSGTLPMHLRDALGPIYSDPQFAALFAPKGRYAEAPGCLALVCVFQFLENLSDRQAADAVRLRIDWKYALGLSLDDQGFSHTVLTDFRDRLVTGQAEYLLLETLLQLCASKGWLKTKRQRTDATHVLAAVRSLNRTELVVESMRAALEELAQVAPSWLQTLVPFEWYERYGARAENARFPSSKSAHASFLLTVAQDGFSLLEALWHPDTPAQLRRLPFIDILRRVWLQQFQLTSDSVQQRQEDNLPPAHLRLISPYDPDARSGVKGGTVWDGYKVHLTETVTESAPQLITHVETTDAAGSDQTALPRIQQALVEAGRAPEEQLTDSGYASVDNLDTSRQKHQIDHIAPSKADTSWQGQNGQGYAVSDFQIHWSEQYACCPQGHRSTSWSERQNHRSGVDEILIRFPAKICQACPVREACTKAQKMGRTLTVRPEAKQRLLQWARVRQKTSVFRALYAKRAGIEATISQSVRVAGLRRSRYRTAAKTHLQHIFVAIAINIVRICAWWKRITRTTTRTSAFRRLTQNVQLVST